MKEQETDMMTNNHSNNLNDSNVCGLCAIKLLSSKACESEFVIPDGDMETTVRDKHTNFRTTQE
jgi:hypothetical protein